MLRGWLGLLVALGVGCATQPARYPAENISVPDDSQIYTAEARPDGVTGGPGAQELEAELVALLKERGDQAQPDGALGATASWGLREVNHGRSFDGVATDAACRHFGFGGVVLLSAAFDMRGAHVWRDSLAAVPRNLPITRYGISVSPAGRSGALVLGNMEVSYEPISRAFEPGQSVTMKGEVSVRHRTAQLFLTKPDGTVDQKDLTSRSFNESFALMEPGAYRLEVMGIGQEGPSVVANLPLYVGVPEPLISNAKGGVMDPERAEARLLALLNRARVAAGVGALRADPELREIALSHTEDMIDHHFAAHVSPRTGGPEDRAYRAGLVALGFSENIALAGTPDQAHDNLMASPGHRKNMLNPAHTHVGIAAGKSDLGLVVTVNFARRPKPEAVPKTTAQVQSALQALRAGKGLSALPVDRVYAAGAQAGADTLARGAEPAEVTKAVQAGIQAEVTRARTSRPAACIYGVDLLELAQLDTIPDLVVPSLTRVGIGTRLREDAKGIRLSTVFVMEGPTCK